MTAPAPPPPGASAVRPARLPAAVRAALAGARADLNAGRPAAAVAAARDAMAAAIAAAADASDPDREDPLPPDLSPRGLLHFATTRGIIGRPAYFAAEPVLRTALRTAGGTANPRDADGDPAARDPAEAVRVLSAAAEEALETFEEWACGPAAPRDRRAA